MTAPSEISLARDHRRATLGIGVGRTTPGFSIRGHLAYPYRSFMQDELLSSDAYYLLNTDGGMINTGQRRPEDPPGEAAVAVVLSQIRSRREHVIDGYSGAIGPATNDVAEYRALIEGLTYALRRGAQKIRAYMDSEFVVEQVNGRAKIDQDDLVSLHREVARLASEFAPAVGFRLSWVPRERNETADALVQAILYG